MRAWRVSLCVCLLCVASPVFGQATPEFLQWDYCALTPANADVSLDTPSATVGQNSWYGEPFPFTVPTGKALGIIGVQVSSKLRASLRSGYFNVDNVLSIPSDIGHWTYPTPFVVPAGVTLHGHLINNGDDSQWMCAWIQGVLIDAAPGQSYRRLFPPMWGLLR